MDRLVDGLLKVLDHAGQRNMPLAFEPEPGMFIDRLDRYGDLVAELERRRLDVSLLQLMSATCTARASCRSPPKSANGPIGWPTSTSRTCAPGYTST
jgi:hypothetical protein